MSQISDDARGALMMTASMAAFTLNDSFMKAATAEVPLFQSIVVRGVICALALALIAQAMGGLRLRYGRSDIIAISLRCLGEVLGTFTFLAALKHMPLANLSAILQSLPLLVTLAAALFLRETIGPRRLAAILVGFIGVLLIIRPGTEGFDRWSVLGVLSVFCVVLRDLSTRRLSPGVQSASVAFFSAVSVTLAALVVSPLEGWSHVSLHQGGLLVGAAFFLIGGYLASVTAMRTGAIAFVAPFRYTALVFAIVLGFLMFGQLPDAWTLAGAGIVVATGLYTFHRERKRALAGMGDPA